MRRITPDELKTILENHKHWWNEDCEGWENMKANLSDANLSGADLSRANLIGADLSDADLSDADLSRANLSRANLSDANLSDANLIGADLSRANLSRANLIGADLIRANLSDANLSDADLSRANLSRANLSDANLIGADLIRADLIGADLSGADLIGADLSGANLSDADLIRANLIGAKGITMACPSDGAFIGWKKAITDNGIAIVKLQITEDAKRSSATGRKCRCDKAQVLAIFDEYGKEIETAHSDRDSGFVYKTGEIVVPDSFDENRWEECSNGIHFFITRTEAEEYNL